MKRRDLLKMIGIGVGGVAVVSTLKPEEVKAPEPVAELPSKPYLAYEPRHEFIGSCRSFPVMSGTIAYPGTADSFWLSRFPPEDGYVRLLGGDNS